MVKSEGNFEISAGTLVSELLNALNDIKGLPSFGLKLLSTWIIFTSSKPLERQLSSTPRGEFNGVHPHGLKELVFLGQMAGGTVVAGGLLVVSRAEVVAMKTTYVQ